MTVLDHDVTCQLPHLVLELTGDLDISRLHQLRELLDEAVSLRPDRLVLDFSRCGHLDAQVIRCLLDVHADMWRQQGRLVLRGCSADALRLLALAGVLQVFELDDDTSLAQV